MESSNCGNKRYRIWVCYLKTSVPNAISPPELTIKQNNNTSYSLCCWPVSSFGSQASVLVTVNRVSYSKNVDKWEDISMGHQMFFHQTKGVECVMTYELIFENKY